MNRGFYNAANGMIMNQRKIDTYGNNLTNMSTSGYKADTPVTNTFQKELILVQNRRKLSGTFEQTYIERTPTNLDQGSLEYTESKFDVAINGEVYFNVAGFNGQTLLTRNGQWELDGEGYLCANSSGRILGNNGEIQIGTSDFVIDNKGNIIVDGVLIDTLRLSYIDSANSDVTKVGANLFSSENAEEIPEGLKYDIIQGAYERSNIDVNYQMTQLMDAQRLFEANSSILKQMDAINAKAASEICRV